MKVSILLGAMLLSGTAVGVGGLSDSAVVEIVVTEDGHHARHFQSEIMANDLSLTLPGSAEGPPFAG